MLIHAVFLTDARGLDLARYSIASFLKSQGPTCDVTLYCDGFEFCEDEPLRDFAGRLGVGFQSRRIDSSFYRDIKVRGHISRTAYAKFAAVVDASIGYDRVLYLDTDILFFDKMNLSEFDFKSNAIAAGYDVADSSGVTDEDFQKSCQANNVSPNYFNSGLLFFDVKSAHLEDELLSYNRIADEHQQACPYKPSCRTNDQCVWNILFEGRWSPVPIDWNVQSSMRFTETWQFATVRHYTGRVKFLPPTPWRSDGREVAYLKRLSTELRLNLQTVPNPLDIVYYANSLRWGRAIKRINQAVADVNSRITAFRAA